MNLLFAQNVVPFNELYLENDLVYEKYTDKLFTGSAAKIRKNGHVVYEDVIAEGKMIKTIIYFNKTTLPAFEYIYYENSGKAKEEIKYSLKEPIIEFTHFNELGEKTLSEIYENDTLTYRCEFLKNRKHGKEFCINKNGKEVTTEYKNGKQLK